MKRFPRHARHALLRSLLLALTFVLAAPVGAQDAGSGSAPAAAPAAPVPIAQVQAPSISNKAAPAAAPATPADSGTTPAESSATPPAIKVEGSNGKAGEPAKPDADKAKAETKPQDTADANERHEFQEFVAEATGQRLPIFGRSLFRDAPSTFAPLEQTPVTPNYLIQPGDQLVLRVWGQVDVNYTATVDRNGQISIPKVGVFSVSGVQYKDLETVLKNEIGKIYRNFELNVTMGRLSAIQIFVVGQAQRPGAYTVSSLSTLVNALFVSGGPTVNGSMRRIELKRSNRVVSTFDLYDLLVRGDKSRDMRLVSGDVIYIPPAGPLAAIAGSVKTSAIFELKGRETFRQLIDLAGGFTTTAQGQIALVDRIENRTVRRVEQFTLDRKGLAKRLADGDVITIASITPRFENAVRLQGNVQAPARYPWRPGMRVTDLLLDKNALITTAYWTRQNQGASYRFYNRREVNFDYATVQRLERDGLVTRLYAFNLGRAIRGDATDNVELQAGDVVTIYSYEDKLPRTENDIVLQGTVLGLPARRFAWREGMRVRDLIPSARWLTEYTEYWLRARDPNAPAEINWDYASIERLNPTELKKELIPFDLGAAVLEGDPKHDIALKAGDEVTLYSKSEIAGRRSRRQVLVRLEGEFLHAGVYQAEPGETLRQLVLRAGGVTEEAYIFGSALTRESTRREQEIRFKRVLEEAERDLRSAQVLRAGEATTSGEAAGAAEEIKAQERLFQRLSQLKPTGRIVLELPSGAKIADVPPMALENGDRYYIPPRPSMVSVFGTVFQQSAFLYKDGRNVEDYIDLAGGPRKQADEGSIFLIRADGSIRSQRQSGSFGGSLAGYAVMPGDAIVVPQDFERVTWTKVLKDWTSILYQLGLGAAAIKVLRD